MSDLARGYAAIAPEVAAEFGGLVLAWQTVPARREPSPPAVRERLRALADRFTGARVVAMRTQPLAHAYRAFFRHIGLDPDVTRVPSEQTAVRRLLEGGLRSRDLVEDAVTVAIVETGVPVWALDAAGIDPPQLRIRTAAGGDRLGGAPLLEGELVVADRGGVIARLFGEVAPEHIPSASTREVALVAIGVDGVPPIFLDEALWLAAEVLGGV